jgi:lon-related putative ATP-dependent protease
MTNPSEPLAPEKLFTRCDPAEFSFKTTAELEPLDGILGQERAVQAIRFGIGMRHNDYNLFVLGDEGVGKYTLVRRFVGEQAAKQPIPSDWCYIHNFVEPHRPHALALPPGRSRALKSDMEHLVDELQSAIPAAFESDDYRSQVNVIEEEFKEQHEKTFQDLQKKAGERSLALIRTPVGFALAPVREGEVIDPKEFNELPEEERKKFKEDIEELEGELQEALQKLPKWIKDQREKIRALNKGITEFAVNHLIEETKAGWRDIPRVQEYLEAVRADVIENVEDFLPQEQNEQQQALMAAARMGARAAAFRRYQVNVLVDHACPDPDVTPPTMPATQGEIDDRDCAEGTLAGAPVIYEDHPTQPNLIGRIEHQSQFGTLTTDFTLIKAGALHRANGGFLILDARRVLTQPFAWETLMRAVRSRRVRIESAAESMGWAATTTLEPELIPLDVKVVLLGEPELYYLLNAYDPDFKDLFKVTSDFGDRMARDDTNAQQYARLIGSVTRKHDLRPLDPGGVARIIEHGARLVEDAEKLTAKLGDIEDLVREADYWAGEAGAAVIAAAHVQQAIDAKIYRSDRIRERIQEEIQRGTFVIDTDGEHVGEINGLAVSMLDGFAFGRPSRISCRVRLGRGEVIDIEREVDLGGPLHSKGVLILSSYLASHFTRHQPLSLSASLVFEQSYGGVDGDSASSTELYVLLSALSEIPIKQSFAVTGSVDQHGRVQAIGGVNEKIEGFFDVCKTRGLTGEQGVLIPASNVKHLMLRDDIVQAAAAGKFRIFPVATVDEGIEILTGVPAGTRDKDGQFPYGSVNRAVEKRLEHLASDARRFASRALRAARLGNGGRGGEGGEE